MRGLQYALAGAIFAAGAILGSCAAPETTPDPARVARHAPPAYASPGDALELVRYYPAGCRGIVKTPDGWTPEGCPTQDREP